MGYSGWILRREKQHQFYVRDAGTSQRSLVFLTLGWPECGLWGPCPGAEGALSRAGQVVRAPGPGCLERDDWAWPLGTCSDKTPRSPLLSPCRSSPGNMGSSSFCLCAPDSGTLERRNMTPQAPPASPAVSRPQGKPPLQAGGGCPSEGVG